ncbi:hypothetical protein HDU67_009357 [Dinochytrium kinnereticum]|nr:hypothetical protein HDU67_009357 [Dinochytrium kinnereticum]
MIHSHLPAPSASPSHCAAAASFLVNDPADREELAARLVYSSRGSEAASIVFPSDPSSTTASSSSSASPHIHLSGVDRHEDSCPTIHTIANFLLRNDTDREELVSTLRIQAVRGAVAAAASGAAAGKPAVPAAAASSGGGVKKGVYGMDERDVFNQLVMLENPAMVFSKL